MTDDKYEELLRQSSLVLDSNYEIERAIINQIEFVRKQYGLNHEKFSTLLGVPRNSYSKITSDQGRNIPFMVLLTFCRLFGYDLSQLYSESVLENTDTVIRELAVFLTTLSDESIEGIKKVISASEKTQESKDYGEELLDKLKRIDKPQNHLFAADYNLK